MIYQILLLLSLWYVSLAALLSLWGEEPKKAALKGEDVKALIQKNNELGLRIFNGIGEKDKNLVFSPYCFSTAMEMAYIGAAGVTQSQMARVLNFNLQSQRLSAAAAILTGELFSKSKIPYEQSALLIKNSIWVQSGHPLLPEFTENITKNFGGIVKTADFRKKGESVRLEINEWIQGQSKGKISDLILSGELSYEDRIVLASAISIVAKWQKAFNPARTRPMPFFPHSSQTLTLPMMFLAAELNYLSQAEMEVVELPYNFRDEPLKISLLLILPKETFGLSAIEESLSMQRISDLINGLKPTWLSLSLPKFKVDSQGSFKNILQQMGLREPFSVNADFSAINSNQNLELSNVFQKASFAIDEKGSEAGIATPFAARALSLENAPEIVSFDHPFMFFLVEKTTGSILMMGRIVTP